MNYVTYKGSEFEGTQIILEPEDWSPEEWKTLLKLFGMEEAEQIVLSSYEVKAYGTLVDRKE